MIGIEGNHMVGDESEYYNQMSAFGYNVAGVEKQYEQCNDCGIVAEIGDMVFVRHQLLCPECVDNPKHIH